jgi:hypothetical protein
VQDAAGCCVTWTCWPPTVTVAVRELPVEFASTVKPTVALPLPLALPLLIVSQELSELVAVHAQPAWDARATLPEPPAAVKLVVDEVAV